MGLARRNIVVVMKGEAIGVDGSVCILYSLVNKMSWYRVV